MKKRLIAVIKKTICTGFIFSALLLHAQNSTSSQIIDFEKNLNKITDPEEQIKHLLTLAKYYQENNLEKSTYYRKTLEKKINNFPSIKIDYALLLITEFILKENYDRALEKINELKNDPSVNLGDDNLLKINYLEAHCYSQQKNYIESRIIVEATLKKHKTSKSTIIAEFHLLKAKVSYSGENIKTLLKETLEAKKIFEYNNDHAGLNKCMISFSYGYMYVKNYEQALIYAENALTSNRAAKSKYDLMLEELAVGTCYSFLQKHKLAETHLYNVLKINKELKLNNTRIYSIALRYINFSNFQLGKYEAVISYCTNELNNVSDNYSKYALYFQMAATYNKTKNFTAAKRNLDLMKVIIESSPNFTDIDRIDFYTEAYKTEAGLGNYKQAYAYSKSYIDRYTSIMDSINALSTIENQARFELKEKDIKLKNFKLKEQASKLILFKAEQERKILIVLICTAILALVIITYFTKKLATKNKLIQAHELELEQSNKTIKRTFSIISHDLKDPFNAVLGYSDYILRNFDDITNSDIQNYVTSIHEAATNNLNFTTQLLTWSLQQQGGFKVNKVKTDVDKIVEQALLVLQPFAVQNHINLIQEKSQISAAIDEDIVLNVLNNLLSNSIKNSVPNDAVIVRYYTATNQLVFEIIDEGIGVSSEQLEKLNTIKPVEKFEFIKIQEEYKGGFGLQSVKALIQLYGGSIVFIANKLKGTTVIISFPL